jgi:hypothetical protein
MQPKKRTPRDTTKKGMNNMEKDQMAKPVTIESEYQQQEYQENPRRNPRRPSQHNH